MKYLYAIFLSAFSVFTFAQELPCGVDHNDPLSIELQRRQRLVELRSMPNPSTVTYVPLKIHVFALDNGFGYYPKSDINDAVARLNEEYIQAGVQFYFSGSDFSYYANSQFYNGTFTINERDAFHNANATADAINVYIPNTVYVSGTSVSGYAAIAPTTQIRNRIWIRKNSFNNDRVAIHEFGHYFSLQHTFNGMDSAPPLYREYVTRNFNEAPPRYSANCNDYGDFLCDTPADPWMAGAFPVVNCQYVGTGADINGDPYDPEINNFMSYYICPPMQFTQGQLDRIADGLLIAGDPSNEFTLNAPETPQSPPFNLTAELANGWVSLSWQDNSIVETGYFIERATSPDGPWTTVHGMPPNSVFYELPAVPNLPNYFRIKPSNSIANYSAVSNPVTYLDTPQQQVGALALFPNPVREVLYVSSASNLEQVVIMDMAGKVVMRPPPGNAFNVETLAQGMYILKAASGNQHLVAKFVRE